MCNQWNLRIPYIARVAEKDQKDQQQHHRETSQALRTPRTWQGFLQCLSYSRLSHCLLKMPVAHRNVRPAAIADPLVTALDDAPVSVRFVGRLSAECAGHCLPPSLYILKIAFMKTAATSGTMALPAALSCATRL